MNGSNGSLQQGSVTHPDRTRSDANTIIDLMPYTETKDSGVPWLGQVPDHWKVLPNRALFAEVKEREHPEEQMLSVTITRGVIRQRALLEGSSKKDGSNQDKSAYKLVCAGDIAYNKMRAWQGAIGVSDLRGIISPAYVVMRLREDGDPRYFHYLFRTPRFAKEAERWSYGITSDMWSLRPEHFKMIYCSLPSKGEQSAIVRFLDYVDRRIRRYIRAKQKLIELLEEQRQAIIHRAVTRGLDPQVPLKPSGVEWLGDVPEHWAVSPLGVVADVIDPNPSHRNPTYVDIGWPFISTVEFIGTDDIELNTPRRVAESTVIEQEQRCAFRLGSTAFSRKGTIGAARILPYGVRFALLDSVCVINCKPQLDYRYLYRQINSGVVTAQLGALVRGAALKQVSLGRVRGTRILLPPQHEQEKIVELLQAELPALDSAIGRAVDSVRLLREYRTRVIADVVTGKLDVRGVELPAVDEPEGAEDLFIESDVEAVEEDVLAQVAGEHDD